MGVGAGVASRRGAGGVELTEPGWAGGREKGGWGLGGMGAAGGGGWGGPYMFKISNRCKLTL